MVNIEKKIELFNSKLENSTELEKIVYLEAINLLNDEVNPDKVNHWVNTVLNTFKDKPKPLSDKEKQKNEQRLINKKLKIEKIASLKKELNEFIQENGVIAIGFFERLSDFEYDLLIQTSANKGYYFDDFGDGALEPFVTTKPVDKNFYEKLRELRFELEDLNQDVNYTITGSEEFLKRVMDSSTCPSYKLC